jgi:hypothetical protein
MRVFMAEKMREMLPAVMETAKGIDVERLVIVDNGDGSAVSSAASQRANAAYALLEGLASRFGLNVDQLIRGVIDKSVGQRE